MSRYLISAWGTRGDVQPACVLAAGLRARGHDVVFAAPPGSAADAKTAGVRFEPLGDDPLAWFDEVPKRRQLNPVRVGPAFFRVFQRQVDQQFEALVPLADGVDAVIGQGLMYGAPSAAQHHGVPYHYLCPNPFLLPSASHPPIGVPFPHLPRVANRLAWRQFAFFYQRGFRRRINRQRRAIGLPAIESALGHVFAADSALLCFDPELYPPPPDWHLAKSPVGSLHPKDEGALDDEVERFLGEGDAPVYAGFGSMTDPNPAATTRVLVDAARAAGRRIIVSQGWARLGSGFDDADDVYVIGPVPHQALFPRVAVVVHHGGVGTASAAARAGTPQVVVPHAYDQPASAASLVRAGVAAASIPRRRLGSDRLAAAISGARQAETVQRAAEVGDSINRRDPLATICDQIDGAR